MVPQYSQFVRQTGFQRLSKDSRDKLMWLEKVMTTSKPEKFAGPRNLLDRSWLLLPTFEAQRHLQLVALKLT